MKENKFEIAGLTVTVVGDSDYLYEPMCNFACDTEGEADILITFAKDDWNGNYPTETLVKSELIHVYETESTYIVRFNEAKWVECYICDKNIGKSVIYLTERGRTKKVEYALDREELMYAVRDSFLFHAQKAGRIAVHSASFVYREKVWLFSASSGTGKSTHVSMWHKENYPITDFNGDLAICYLEKGVALAAGSPWCGTSGLYCNQKTPLGGVLYLLRADSNSVEKLSPAEAIMRLSARCLTPNWSVELMNRNVDTAISLAPLMISGVLYCTPEGEAAQVSKTFIDSNLN